MKHITSSVPVNKLLHDTVERIVVSETETAIIFRSGNAVSTYIDNDTFLGGIDSDLTLAAAKLLSVVGEAVNLVSVAESTALTISFTNGICVGFWSDDLPYDSFSIFIDGENYLV